MIKILFFIVLHVLFIISAHAQINVDDSQNIVNLVKKLEGPGVKISNISYHTSPKAPRNPIGYFTDDYGVTGLDKGLLLTTGAAKNAIGPNDMPNKSQGNNDSLQDPDIFFIPGNNTTMLDVCYVEFDFITSSSLLSFSYVFGSEEYIEFIDYPDEFAFIISGPGIAGKKNIALVPGTNSPVSVGTINPNNNSQYYRSNGTGSTPYINLDLQYDGYTRVLKAKADVFPCQTYHIKLIIADMRDDEYDSGVFIEQESFTSRDIELKVMYEHPRFNNAIEGCNKAMIIFKRAEGADLAATTDLTYKYYIKGNALNGTDYVQIPDSIVIPAGQDSAYVTIDAFADGIPDDAEIVRLVLKNKCPSFPLTDSIDVTIKESFPYSIPSEKSCNGQSVVLNKHFIPGDTIIWDASPYLSCDTCPSPLASPPSSSYFYLTVIDPASGCKARDSVWVETITLKANLNYSQDPCYSSLDYFFTGESPNATSYNWSFGDNTTSSEPNPQHQFPFLNKKDQVQYNVTLVVSRESPSCSADTSITISINNPLFIPNLVTPDQNALNDYFKIMGISGECWRLQIYNRWNSRVYQNDHYKNDFTGGELAEGVYYFHLENHPKNREFKGWLHIIK
jgi:hypothetical protein